MHILLAEHHSQVLRALQTLLKEQTEYTLVGEATDVESLLDQAEKTKPDLVLLAWELPGRPGAEIIAALNTLDSRPLVIVLSSKLEVKEPALDAGADAFVSKGDPPRKLLIALYEMQVTLEEQATTRVNKVDKV
jgi:DNA-binding NarL/FixJ family response regulator